MAKHMLLCTGKAGAIIGMPALTIAVGENSAYGMASLISTKGASHMMDCLMAGTLLVGFGLVWLLVNWCRRQVDSQE